MAASAAPPTQDGPVTTTGKKCRLLDLICGPIDHNQPGGATKTQKNKTATRCLQGCDDNRLPAPSGKSCPLSIWTNQMENRSGTARGPVSTKQPNTNTSWVNFFHSPSGQTCPGLVTKWKPTDLGETRGGAQQATEEQHRLVNPSHFPSAPHCPGLVVASAGQPQKNSHKEFLLQTRAHRRLFTRLARQTTRIITKHL